MSGTVCRCGAPVPAKTYQGNPRRWCSAACRVRHSRMDAGQFTRLEAESRDCKWCGESFQPKIERSAYCSDLCGTRWRDSQRPRSEDWAAGRRTEREIPCMDCGTPIMSRANKQSCEACKAERSRTTNRRKNVKRRGAAVGIRYTLLDLGERDGWRCHLCRRKVDSVLPGTHPMGPTVDHLIPISAGGLDELENVALAHRACNVQRRDKGIAQLRLTG